MKKTGQALFLILFMMAGASDSVATGDAGAAPATHKRINLDSTQDSSKKTHPQNKKQPGWFNQYTQYAGEKAASVQEYYNALDSTDQNTIHVLAILAAVGAMAALRVYAGGSKPEAIQEGGINEQNTVNPPEAIQEGGINEQNTVNPPEEAQECSIDDGKECSIDEQKTVETLLDKAQKSINKTIGLINQVYQEQFELIKFQKTERVKYLKKEMDVAKTEMYDISEKIMATREICLHNNERYRSMRYDIIQATDDATNRQWTVLPYFD